MANSDNYRNRRGYSDGDPRYSYDVSARRAPGRRRSAPRPDESRARSASSRPASSDRRRVEASFKSSEMRRRTNNHDYTQSIDVRAIRQHHAKMNRRRLKSAYETQTLPSARELEAARERSGSSRRRSSDYDYYESGRDPRRSARRSSGYYYEDDYYPGKRRSSGQKIARSAGNRPVGGYSDDYYYSSGQNSRQRKAGSRSRSASAYSPDRRNVNNYYKYNQKKRKKKHSKAFLIILPILIILLAAVAFVGVKVCITKNHATALKNDLEKVLECTKAKDADGAEAALLKSYEDREKLEESLEDSFWTTASKISRVDKELSAGKELIDVVETAQDDILKPLVTLMKEKPLTELKVGEEGFNVALINSYLDFLEDIMPNIDSLIEKIMQVDTNSLMGGYVSKIKDKLYEYTDSYKEASAMLPFVRTFLGSGEDRLYLFVAQNSAEIRASGGFPGSIGTIRIKDGVLTIGDFESVYDVLSDTISYKSKVTDSEYNIFGSWINAPRDACFIPAFDRTAEIWSVAYEDRQRENGAIDGYKNYLKENSEYDEETEEYTYYDVMTEEEYYEAYGYPGAEYVEYVDGVVSLTPAIIQMLMQDIGAITLSDGSVLDSTNATKMLQYDLYHKYFDENTITETSNWQSDTLFAETAKIVMKEFVSNFEISKFADYFKLFQEAKDENILMIWMADKLEEDTITETGFSGKLNYDPEDPFTGIYFSLADPSKLGWYLDIIPQIGACVENEDGSKTYDITVTLRNVMDDYDVENSSWYIIGGYNGGIRGYVHCFAPAGGYLSDVETDNGMYMFEANYKDLEVYYDLDVLLEPGEEVNITYKATTAPGVDAPLRTVTTPTLTKYR